MEEKLNKCPFCGGEAQIVGRKKIKVMCTQCGAASPIFDFRSQAVSNWNKRTTEKSIRKGEQK